MRSAGSFHSSVARAADTSSRSSCRGSPPTRRRRGSRARIRAAPRAFGGSRAQRHLQRPAECRRRPAEVHDHVEHRADRAADELALRVLDLVVEAAQHAAARARVVVLHEVDVDAGGGQCRRFQLSKEEAAVIAEDPGLDQLDVGDGGGRDLHRARSRSEAARLAQEAEQVAAIGVLRQRVAQPLELRRVDVAEAEGDLLGQAIFSPCRRSIVSMYCDASSSDSWSRCRATPCRAPSPRSEARPTRDRSG